MENYQKKEQDYAKWDQTIWLSVEKEVSQFQTKVNASMVSLGSLNKTKAEDFKVQPLLQDDVILGQQFYVQVIRPIFVSQGYLPKQPPTQKDLQGEEESDQQQEEKQKSVLTKVQQKKQEKVKQQKKGGGGKKGSKNNQSKNQAEVKMKIVKQNFMKDIDLLLNSHSLQRMQYQYGLKQKKLQVRLMTFFYIAYYIRKNKQKQKIDEAQTFELINILVKIVRIFDGYKGKSFFTSQKKKKGQEQLIEVSRTLILDIKLCIKGLKQMYKYSNKKVIINYPKLVYYTNYDRFFPTLDIKPYPSQIQFIQAVKSAFNIEKGSIAKPTLILYRTMIGSGKTSASISLANLINQTKLLDIKNANYQVLYSCLISSVRVQVGRYAYHSKQKFALAAMEKSIKYEDYYYPRIINSYSCRNQKVVDLVISDLVCGYAMLSHHHLSQKQKDIFQWQRKNRKKAVNVGMLDKQNIIMFIDEPTAFCKDVNSPATQKLFHILGNYPPKVIILASATMPPKQQLKNTIALVEQKNPGLQVIQIESKQFQIGCQYSSFKGQIIFPHTGVKSRQQLKNIIKLIENNPFLLRLYTGPSLYFLLKKCQAHSIKGLPKIQNYPQIRQQDISKCTIKILKSISQQQDSKIQQICKLSADQSNIDYKVEQQKQQDSDDDIFGDNDQQQKQKQRKKKQEQEKSKTDYVNFKKMLRDDAYKFLGGCLIAVENPQQFAKKHFEKWMIINRKQKQSIKSVRRLLQKYKRQVQALQREIKLLQDDPRRDDVITKLITKLRFQKQPKMDFPDYKRINTADHYKRYCKDKQNVHQSMLIKPMPIELVAEELIQQVDDFTLRLLFCGVALYMQNGLSSKYLDKVEELASQNYLAYIITDQSLCYGTNFPISNVILCDDLVQKLNMNQIFQLIGRAGRVGQSWTARAFLQEKGLQKLHKYIHSQDKKMSEQAQIFEIIAKDYLDNPNLCLRTLKSQIKYIDQQKPDQRLQIIIKKKNVQDYHIFRKIVVVPYLESDKRILSYKHPHQSVNYFELAQSEISYYDLPTKKNSHDVSIINVQAYYKNEQQFIRTALNNAVARILKQKFEGKISIEGQVNQFKPKVYEQFFNMQTNTFVVLVKCKDDIKVGNFAFNKLVSNSLQKLDENLTQKIHKYVEQCKKLAKVLRQNPQSIFANDVKQIKAIHADLMQRPKTKYYMQAFKHRQQEMKKQYDSIIAHIEDKSSLQAVQQSVLILFVSKYSDFVNVEDRLFHIDSSARKIWQNVLKQIQK